MSAAENAAANTVPTTAASRLAAVLAYIPVIGWLYALVFARRDPFAIFHLRQSIGLFLYLFAVFVAWAAASWLLAWIPFGGAFSAALFAIVIVIYLCGLVAWAVGVIYALSNRLASVPIFGGWGKRLPIR